MLGSFHNPDVLSCLANLSSDEVFTPPNVVNQMLDTLPTELWSDKTVTFLDPVSKSGVFLREITKRLIKGLANEFPDIEERIEHIIKNQVFGLGITKLTSEISRRTLYCSKKANGEYSIVDFNDEEGNLKYIDSHHFWSDGVKCKYCGVNKKLYQRNKGLESYAYSFIHEDKPEELFNMKFDVIIGNPPYQMNDGGGTGSSALPLYDKFVENAKRLKPRFISMIIPSRWFSGGRGLDKFRDGMLSDRQITQIHDFPNPHDCFPGVPIEGGVCFFLWENGVNDDCQIVTRNSKGVISSLKRPLLEKGLSTFIRYNEAIPILKKVLKFKEKPFSKIVSFNDPFGFDKRETGSYKRIKPSFSLNKSKNKIEFYYNGWEKEGIGFIEESKVSKNLELIHKYKLLISKAYGMGKDKPYKVINKPIISLSPSCCTETYLVVGPFETQQECENVKNYMETKFFRFLVLLIKNTQNAMNKIYSLVPEQNFHEQLTDKYLYEKYSLSKEEIDFIEELID